MNARLKSFRALELMQAGLTGGGADPGVPDEVVGWLARLRLLEGVPFNYLVPHDELLPAESIRFFYLDRNWTDAAVQGALSVGGITSRDRELLGDAHPRVRERVDHAERLVRAAEVTAERRERLQEEDQDGEAQADKTGPAGVVSGFLLRSRAVSGWPGLQVHAERDGQRLRFLRLERLAPAVLLALFDGIPDTVNIEEPRQGIQFGIDQDKGGTVPLKDPSSGEALTEPGTDELRDSVSLHAERDDVHVGDGDMQVPFRAGSPGVVHVTDLADRLASVELSRDGESGPLVDDEDDGDGTPALDQSDQLAVQLLQFPYRQPFNGQDGDEGSDWFVPTLSVDVVLRSHQGDA